MCWPAPSRRARRPRRGAWRGRRRRRPSGARRRAAASCGGGGWRRRSRGGGGPRSRRRAAPRRVRRAQRRRAEAAARLVAEELDAAHLLREEQPAAPAAELELLLLLLPLALHGSVCHQLGDRHPLDPLGDAVGGARVEEALLEHAVRRVDDRLPPDGLEPPRVVRHRAPQPGGLAEAKDAGAHEAVPRPAARARAPAWARAVRPRTAASAARRKLLKKARRASRWRWPPPRLHAELGAVVGDPLEQAALGELEAGVHPRRRVEHRPPRLVVERLGDVGEHALAPHPEAAADPALERRVARELRAPIVPDVHRVARHPPRPQPGERRVAPVEGGLHPAGDAAVLPLVEAAGDGAVEAVADCLSHLVLRRFDLHHELVEADPALGEPRFMK